MWGAQLNGFYRDECVSVTNTRERDEERERERERRVEREELFLQRRREIRTLGEIDVVCFFMCNGKRRGRKLTRSLVYSIFLLSFHFGKKKEGNSLISFQNTNSSAHYLNEHTHLVFDTTTEMFFHHLYHHHHPCIERRLLL